MVLFTLFVFFKVPETKGMTFEEIANQFQPGGTIEVEEVVDDDVFGGGEYDEDEEGTAMMNSNDRQRNGSVASTDKPEEKMSLTKSAENIHNVDV